VLVSLLRLFLPPYGGKKWSHVRHQRGMTASSTTSGEQLPFDDYANVSAWRLRRLLQSGFPPPLAMQLANTPGIDLHALLDLVDRGCRPEMAARILDPFIDSDAGW
jgi:hypothetical protein